MNIFEQIIHDQEQRKREPVAKMSKNDAKALLLEGITTKDAALVAAAVKNGARVRGMVDGQDLFVTCLKHFDLSVFQLLFPTQTIKSQKDLRVLTLEGDHNCLEYFSNDLIERLDGFSYSFRSDLERNTNIDFAQWMDDHLDEFIASARKHSVFRHMAKSLPTVFMVVLKFAARIEHTHLTTHIAQQVTRDKIPTVDDWEFDVFNCSLENVSNIAKTVDGLPFTEKNTVYDFFGLNNYSLGGNIWMDNALQRNLKHVETVLKSPAGCQYIEQRLTQPDIAENFLNNNIIHHSIPQLVQWQNVLRLKNVYQNWTSSRNLNIVQHLIGYMVHPAQIKNEMNHPENSKLVDTLLRIDPNGFHIEFPEDHLLKGTTPFSCLSVELQAQVSKFILQQNVGKPTLPKAGTGKRKI